MDPKLAEMYGTNTPDDADLEKLAAAELADQLADDDQMDLDNIDPDALEALAEEVLSSNDDGDDGDDDQVKLAEADYLGRVMAHSYVQELRNIEKTADGGGGDQSHGMGYGGEEASARKGGSSAVTHAEAHKGRFRRAHEAVEEFGQKGTDAIGRAAKRGAGHVASGARAVGAHAMRNRGKYGLGLAALGTAGTAKAVHSKMKQSSALETLVEQRAYEILAENGVDIEKVAAEEGRFSRAHKATEEFGRKGTDAVGRAAKRGAGHVARGARAVGAHAMRNRGKYGIGAAGLTLAGGAKAVHSKMKQSSALDTLIEQRAYEILEENGIELDGQEKTSGADEYDVLANVVEQQAWNLLAENGYVSDE